MLPRWTIRKQKTRNFDASAWQDLMAFTLRIGSRPSALALAQANQIKRLLDQKIRGLNSEVVPISTSGDKLTTASLARVGGKGLFVRELEQALDDGRIDIAVHSMKDLPALIPREYRLAAVPERENPYDALITRTPGGWDALTRESRLGTSSARRRFEATRVRPDLQVVPLRGNIDTRLRRLDAGDFDAIILAVAGLRRLGGYEGINLVELNRPDFVPSGGQGALAIEAVAEARIAGSVELEKAVTSLSDIRASAEISAERAFLATIGASCVSPVGVKGSPDGKTMSVHALLFSTDGFRSLEGEIAGPCDCTHAPAGDHAVIDAAVALGADLGRQMLDRGAGELIGHG
jgi:hydroxymethylbilane synthase